jgi:DNA 3'-phosphatase
MLRFAIILAFAVLVPSLARADDVVRAQIGAGFRYTGGPVKVLVLDADQTVRISSTQFRAPRDPSQVIILPGVRAKIAEYQRQGYFVAIMSNQVNAVKDSGLGKIDSTMQETVRQIAGSGTPIPYYDFSEREADSKPATAMFDKMQAALKAKFGPGATIDRAHSLYVGDAAYLTTETRPNGLPGIDSANFDRKFAENNHVPYQEPQDFFGWKQRGFNRIENTKDLARYEAAGRAKPWGCDTLFGTLP